VPLSRTRALLSFLSRDQRATQSASFPQPKNRAHYRNLNHFFEAYTVFLLLLRIRSREITMPYWIRRSFADRAATAFLRIWLHICADMTHRTRFRFVQSSCYWVEHQQQSMAPQVCTGSQVTLNDLFYTILQILYSLRKVRTYDLQWFTGSS